MPGLVERSKASLEPVWYYAPMGMWHFLYDIVILLSACLVAGGIFSRLGQSPLVGYLLAGMLLGGPGSIGAVQSQHEIEAVAELGISLLLFSLGLEFSFQRLRAIGGKTLASGGLQVTITLGIAAVLAMAFGRGMAEGLAIGGMVALSSTACVLRTLIDQGEIDSPHGRNSLAILLVQDVAVVPLAIMLSVIGGDGGLGAVASDLGRILLAAAVLVAALFVLLNLIAVRALATLTLERNRELTVLLAVVTGLGSAWGAHEAGLSPALGAFIAGMFLGSSRFATQIRADISSIRVVLLTLFFGAAGMIADPIWIATHAHWVLGATALVLVGKGVITWLILRAMGQAGPAAGATGICLAQVGEFAFVLGAIALESGVLADEAYRLLVSVTIVTLFVSPFLVPIAPAFSCAMATRFAPKRRKSLEEADSEQRRPPDVFIIGFGPAGSAAAKPLASEPERVLVLDLNAEGIERAMEMGFHGEIGDATQVDVLEHAGMHHARTVVITLPAHSPARTVLNHVRAMAPTAHVVVRSRYQRNAEELRAGGAHAVFGDEEVVGARLASHLGEMLARQRAGDAASTEDAQS